ncbi:cobalamin biosynthesis protein CbiN [Thermosipho melanesiensis]|uniref:Cobalt transport protein CbiN n=2 Tax=Thermosipho melanesiensis TaxID=46541 RepID=A6LKX6_THEM4|nr:energy-coupling factor ABC transporter substrate-binding protein [Thermosipho melanesiensis]ABR30577.1 cobalt transport protein [Thermosipho melanesiensis BI429]APT73725.1 cobalamin biosynthesis protein CbiN [Thermosipho melanesiensis]OOC35663.1 cobalamin biosynthesis protein CbiN [Thermosipho melanesiensis]OOC38962.1 cobalamin biosynthesis protein CbiN [Thermosipho melanesiensis]OOC39110.1 cobalamin biosynthesis protein CbiN [Thermosipho melanesiensis]
MSKKHIILLSICIILVIFSLLINGGAEFSGADGQAEELIGTIAKDYSPWFSPIWEPPSGEIESLLFSLQAALGAIFIGYYFGYMKGRKVKNDN